MPNDPANDATKDTPSARASVMGGAIGLAIGLVVLVTGALLLREHGPGNMWAGYIAGASVALVAAAFAFWRTWRKPAAATTAERAFTPAADERDKAVLTSAGATLGFVGLPLTGVAAVLIAVGIEPAPVLGILLWTQLAVFVVAFVRANRRL